MDNERLQKVILFGELRKKRHAMRQQSWYQLCQERKKWLAKCHEGVDEVASCRKRNTFAAKQPVPRSILCSYVNAGEHLEDKVI